MSKTNNFTNDEQVTYKWQTTIRNITQCHTLKKEVCHYTKSHMNSKQQYKIIQILCSK